MSTERDLMNAIDDADSTLRRTLPMNRSLREQAGHVRATAQRRLDELRARKGGSQRSQVSQRAQRSRQASSAAQAGSGAGEKPLSERVADARIALGIAPTKEKLAAKQTAAEVWRSFGKR